MFLMIRNSEQQKKKLIYTLGLIAFDEVEM